MDSPPTISPVMDTGIMVEKQSSTVNRYAATFETDQVRVIPPAEHKEAALCLSEAFRRDRIVRYPIDVPDRAHWSEEERFELHRQMFEYITYAHCLRGLATTTGDDYGCVALWMPPGKNMDDWLTILRSGLWRLKYKLSSEGKARFFDEFLPLLHKTKHEVLGDRDEETWYLVYIGTKEESRGKGLARRLIENVTQKVCWVLAQGSAQSANMIKQLDEEGRACYLESSSEINLKIYGKLGFNLIKRIFLERGEEQGEERLSLDIMVREPGESQRVGD